MTLREYLDRIGVNPVNYANRIGVSPKQVYRYCEGAIPGREIMARIVRDTRGEVQPNDFYDLPKHRRRSRKAS